MLESLEHVWGGNLVKKQVVYIKEAYQVNSLKSSKRKQWESKKKPPPSQKKEGEGHRLSEGTPPSPRAILWPSSFTVLALSAPW